MNEKKEIIKNNYELLFLFDAKRCNPNGDMDDGNKPRMDRLKSINLVSDVRIKRYIRDYFEFFGNEETQNIFITNKAEKSEERCKQLGFNKIDKKNKEGVDKEIKEKIIDKCIDVRFFGAVLATPGGNDHKTGPIQFSWSESLNKVELQKSKTITSSFAKGEGIGSDYRVNYSFLALSGSINYQNAKKTYLLEEDLIEFDNALIKSLPLNRTRSKIGQYPRLYLKIKMKEGDYFLKDLREFLKLENEEGLRDISEVKLKIDKLKEYLEKNENILEEVQYWHDPNLKILNENDEIDNMSILFKNIRKIKFKTEE